MKSENQENKCIIKNAESGIEEQDAPDISKKGKICLIVGTISGFLILILTAIIMFLSCPKISKELRQEIIDTFAGFENRGEVIFVERNRIFLQDKMIETTGWNYNETKCKSLVGCNAEKYYVLTEGKTDKTHKTLNLLEVEYYGKGIKLLNDWRDLSAKDNIEGFYIEDKLYVGEFDGEYYVYDLVAQTDTIIPEAEFKALKERQSQYEFKVDEKVNNVNIKKSAMEITSKQTGEKITLTMNRLKAFPEGEYILSLDSFLTNEFYKAATEKDGYIYILGMIDLDNFFSIHHQNVVLKYDFENDILSYYSSMLYPWDEIPQMTVL